MWTIEVTSDIKGYCIQYSLKTKKRAEEVIMSEIGLMNENLFFAPNEILISYSNKGAMA